MKSDKSSLDRVFSALGDPLRRDVLSRLEHRSLTVSELAAPYPVSLPAISRHVKLLERAGLINRRVKGATHHLSLSTRSLTAARRWLDIGLGGAVAPVAMQLGTRADHRAGRGMRPSPSPAFRRGLHSRYRTLDVRRSSGG